MADEDGLVWGFGYGSNMNVQHMAESKGVAVVGAFLPSARMRVSATIKSFPEHVAAVLPHFRMTFSIAGFRLVEPAFSGLEESAADDVHGVAFCVTRTTMATLDALVVQPHITYVRHHPH